MLRSFHPLIVGMNVLTLCGLQKIKSKLKLVHPILVFKVIEVNALKSFHPEKNEKFKEII